MLDSWSKIEIVVACIYTTSAIILLTFCWWELRNARSSTRKPLHISSNASSTWEFGFYLRSTTSDGVTKDYGPFVSDDPKKDTYTDPKIEQKVAFWANRLSNDTVIYRPIHKERT